MSQPPEYPPGQGWDSPASGSAQPPWQGAPAQQRYPQQQPYAGQQAYPQQPGQPHPQQFQQPYGQVPPNPKPNTGAFGKAFGAAGVTVLVLFGLIIAAWGLPDSARRAGEVVGRLVVLAGLAGGAVGLIAKGSRKLWPWWQYYLLMVPAVLIVMIVTAAGRA